VGNHITEQGATGYGGINPFGASQGYPSELGNKVALNVGKGGPGTGRKIYGCGTQGVQGEAAHGNPTPKAKELWSGWGNK
jgi:hypothetical protein